MEFDIETFVENNNDELAALIIKNANIRHGIEDGCFYIYIEIDKQMLSSDIVKEYFKHGYDVIEYIAHYSNVKKLDNAFVKNEYYIEKGKDKRFSIEENENEVKIYFECDIYEILVQDARDLYYEELKQERLCGYV